MADPRMEYVQPYPTDLECVVCLTPWTDPVELNCKHVYCRSCTTQLTKCPTCRSNITSKQKAHFLMVNLVDALPVRCKECHYECSRERFRGHTCAKQSPAASIPAEPLNRAWELYHMDQNEYDQLSAIFYNFDDEETGKLNRTQLKKLARCLNFPHTERDIEIMFRAMDVDQSNALSLHEFCWYMKDKKPDPNLLYGLDHGTYRATLLLFHSFDTDSDGALDLAEFIKLCKHFGSPFPSDTTIASELFRRVDLKKNGCVDLHEFLTYRRWLRESGLDSK